MGYGKHNYIHLAVFEFWGAPLSRRSSDKKRVAADLMMEKYKNKISCFLRLSYSHLLSMNMFLSQQLPLRSFDVELTNRQKITRSRLLYVYEAIKNSKKVESCQVSGWRIRTTKEPERDRNKKAAFLFGK